MTTLANRLRGFGNRRRHPRLGTDHQLQLISVASRIDGLLQDLSQTGARISLCSPPPRQGRDVLLRWPGREFFGQVVWSNGLDVGVAFHSPISHEELAETVGRDLPLPRSTGHRVL